MEKEGLVLPSHTYKILGLKWPKDSKELSDDKYKSEETYFFCKTEQFPLICMQILQLRVLWPCISPKNRESKKREEDIQCREPYFFPAIFGWHQKGVVVVVAQQYN